MDQSANAPPSKRIRNSFNARVNSHFGLEPVYKYRSIVQIGRYNPDGYECTICVGNKSICTNKIFKAKFDAASQTAKLGFTEFTQLCGGGGSTQAKGGKMTMKKVEAAEKGWIHVKDIETAYKRLSEDILATQFKDILEQHMFSGNMRKAHYNTQLHSDGGITGYISTLDFNEKTYKSVGLMLSEDQAEQSAAEICLRSIGKLPLIKDPDNFVIQPYQGGSSKKIKGVNNRQIPPPHVFASSAFSDMLKVYLNCHYMQSPRYYTKRLESQYDEAELDADGKPKQMFDCICCFEGKVFKAKYPQVMPSVKELAAAEALRYLGISNPLEKLELKKIAFLHRYDFMERSPLSPFHKSPSKQKSRQWQRFCRNEKYDDLDRETLFSSGIIVPYLWGNDMYMQDLVSRELSRNPSFKNVSLFAMKDLVIAEIDPNNPNLFLIGNSEFSIKMLCDNGKLYSKKRSYDVELLPGHNIFKLNSRYRLTLPSMEVYLKAVDCEDVTFPNPPLPVVASCGTVVLFHDHEASPSDIYVILRKSTTASTCETGSVTVKFLLNYLITPTWKPATPEQCVEGITTWQEADVKLLSEMTMDSMQVFMSKNHQYDDRWNELFARKSLPDSLKELQDLCLKELQRREEEGHEAVEVEEVDWTLPESEFISRFETVGINLEASNKCAFRALLESRGDVRVKLGDIDNCPTVDFPVETDEKEHRGDVMRYYIWKGCQKITGNEKVTYFDQLDAEELPHEEGWKLSTQNTGTSFSEPFTKILKDEYPHGFMSERRKYFRECYYGETPPDVDGNDEGNEDGASAEKGESNGIESGEQDKTIETNGDTEVKEEVEPMNEEEKETETIDADEEKEVEEVDEPIAVDDAITDEYGTIGETAGSKKKTKPPPRATRATRNRNASKKQEDANEGDQDVDEPMKAEDTSVDEVKEGEEEEANTEGDEQVEGESENKDIAEEHVANGKADESMEDGEAKQDNDALDEKAESFHKYKPDSIAWADTKDVGIKKRKRKSRLNRGNRGDNRVIRKMADVRRKALREHCEWMKLDEAVDLCPMLKKISVTPKFQKQIKLLIDEANSFMESKGMSEKVETSVLLDEE